LNCKKNTGQRLNEHFNLLILNIYLASAENIIAMLMEQNYLREKMSFNLFKNKKILIVIIIIIFFLIWAELGVGIFGTRFAGN